MGVATVKVRVCASPGRDKKNLEKKLSATTPTTSVSAAFLLNKGTDDSDSEGEKVMQLGEFYLTLQGTTITPTVCLSDGDKPPTRKKKKMMTDASKAVGSSSSVSSTGPPAPEGGVSSGGEHTGATSLLHEMQ